MLGQGSGLSSSVLEEIRRAELATCRKTGLQLNVALNYGSRAEIVEACRRLAADAARGRIRAEEIDERMIEDRLYTRTLPDPDLLIRTSGERRLSNFLLWQIAYSEIYVTDTLWPDFGEPELLAAIADYQKRDRRFGAIKEIEPDIVASGVR
jgi:undecaprenyl diphosphate synthase